MTGVLRCVSRFPRMDGNKRKGSCMQEKHFHGGRIRVIRELKGLTRKELSKRCGINTQSVANWEADRASPKLSSLPGLARSLGVSTDTILGLEDEGVTRERLASIAWQRWEIASRPPSALEDDSVAFQREGE